jgi:predicted ferric reductase
MALGLLMTNKMTRAWPGVPATFAIHEFVSLLGLAFAMFHGLVLLGDHYINFTLAQVLMPFSTSNFKPLAVGLGQLGFYLFAIVTLSFYVRKNIGQKTWRAIHYISFFAYLGALAHGLMSGTDTGSMWAQVYYWVSGAILLFLLMNRIVSAAMTKVSAPVVSQVL